VRITGERGKLSSSATFLLTKSTLGQVEISTADVGPSLQVVFHQSGLMLDANSNHCFLQKYRYRKDQTTETAVSWSSDTFLFTSLAARNERVCEM